MATYIISCINCIHFYIMYIKLNSAIVGLSHWVYELKQWPSLKPALLQLLWIIPEKLLSGNSLWDHSIGRDERKCLIAPVRIHR